MRPRTAPEVKLTLRLPPELHEALVRAAAENVRSLNGEMVARLGASVKSENDGSDQ